MLKSKENRLYKPKTATKKAQNWNDAKTSTYINPYTKITYTKQQQPSLILLSKIG